MAIGLYLYFLIDRLAVNNIEQALVNIADASSEQIENVVNNQFAIPFVLGDNRDIIKINATLALNDRTGLICAQIIQFKEGLSPEIVEAELSTIAASVGIPDLALNPVYNGNETYYFGAVASEIVLRFIGRSFDEPRRLEALRQARIHGMASTGVLPLLDGPATSIVIYSLMTETDAGHRYAMCTLDLDTTMTLADTHITVLDHTGTRSEFGNCGLSNIVAPVSRSIYIQTIDANWDIIFSPCAEMESRLQNSLRTPLLIVMVFVGIGLSSLVYYFFRSNMTQTQLQASWILVRMMRLYIAAIFQYASHEQKGPLHHMLGSMDVLQLSIGPPNPDYGVKTLTDPKSTPTDHLQALRNIFTRNLMRVDMVVDAIMNIQTLLSAGAPKMHCNRLGDFVNAFVDKWANVMGSNCNIVVYKDPEIDGKTWVCALDAFVKIATIGASNASKFGSAYMPVRVFVQVESGYLWFIIVNTIPHDHLERSRDVCSTKPLFYTVPVPHVTRASKSYQQRTFVGSDTAKTFSPGSGMGLYAANMLATGCDAVVDYQVTTDTGNKHYFTYSIGMPIVPAEKQLEPEAHVWLDAPEMRIAFVGDRDEIFERAREYLNRPMTKYTNLEEIDFSEIDMLIVAVGLGLSPTQVTLRSSKLPTIFVVKDQQSPYMQGIDVHVLHTSFNMHQIRSCVNLASFLVRWDAKDQNPVLDLPVNPARAGDVVQMSKNWV